MNVYEVPLTPTPQTFGIALGGVDYHLTVFWSDDPEGGWFMNLADPSDNPILNGVPLVTGANLVSQYAYLGFTGALVVQTDHDTDALPTFDNLGIGSHLYFVTG